MSVESPERWLNNYRYYINHSSANFSAPQKELNSLNEKVIRGENLREPMHLRFHHLGVTKEILEHWSKRRDQKPFDVVDEGVFFISSVMAAMAFAEGSVDKFSKKLSDHSNFLATENGNLSDKDQKKILSEIEYFEDLLGKDGNKEETVFKSCMLFAFNYIARSRKKEAFVIFNDEPDLICLSCRGGETGIGNHCGSKLKKDVNLAKWNDFLYYTSLSQYLRSGRGKAHFRKGEIKLLRSNNLSDQAAIKYSLLFEKQFYDEVDQIYERVRDDFNYNLI